MPYFEFVLRKLVVYQGLGSGWTRTHDCGTLPMKIALQTPDYGTQNRIPEVFCIEGDVGVIRRHSRDMREEHSSGE